MEMERRVGRGQVILREEPDGQRVLVQRAIPYGEMSVDLGGWCEVIVAGAFADALGDDIRALWQHDSRYVLGRTTAGTLTLREEPDGVHAESTPPETGWARDALVSVARGDVSGSSFGFYVDEDEWLVTGEIVVRRVLRARLAEVSVVTFPAYPTTSAALQERARALRAQGGAHDEANGDAGLRARSAARRRRIEFNEMV